MSALLSRKMSRREAAILVTTLLFGVGAGVYVYVLEPLAYSWVELHNETTAKAEELAKLRGLIQQREAIERAYAKTEGAIVTGLSDEKLTLELMQGVEATARGSGLDVKSVKPATSRRHGELRRQSVQVSVDGEANQFMEFLQMLQRPESSLCAEVLTVSVRRTKPSLNAAITISNLTRVSGVKNEPGAGK